MKPIPTLIVTITVVLSFHGYSQSAAKDQTPGTGYCYFGKLQKPQIIEADKAILSNRKLFEYESE